MKTYRVLALISLAAAAHLQPVWASSSNKAAPVGKTVNKAMAPAQAAEPVDASLSEDQLAAALRVHRGEAQCEFNQTVSVHPHPQRAGLFQVAYKNQTYVMTPEPTTTGAVRLEDKRAGMMWLQIPTKSMLMNSNKGQRVVDACLHSEQRAVLAGNAANPSQAGAGIGITPVVAAPMLANNGQTPAR